MRHNRIGVIAVLLLSVCLFCGCGKLQNLSEEQEDMVVEYAAGVLLRYSDRYDLRLITAEQIAKGESEESAEATATPQVTATPTPEPESISGSGGTETGSTENAGNSDENSLGTDATVSGSAVEESYVSLNEVYQVKDLDFSYDRYQFCKQYPENPGADMVPAKAGANETLLVVTFSIRNQSDKKKHIKLGDRDIQYKLNIEGNEFQPDISILDNMGLNYLDATIAAKRTEKAVLIFTLSKEREKASEMTLTVQDGDDMAAIQLK